MKEEEILDKPLEKIPDMIPLNWLFYLASVFLILRFVFNYMHWPYASIMLLISGFMYEVFSILRLLYYPNKTLFQRYSYIFFIIVIPGFIFDYMYWPGARILLYMAASIPLIYFGHLGLLRLKEK
jgi:hypothetical protein